MHSDPPPQPPRTPVVGHALRWARDPYTIGSWANAHVGGVASLDIFNTEIILVTDPDPIEEVLIQKRDSLPKSPQYNVAFGEGLGSVSGAQWRKQRDAITEFFSAKRIESYAETMVARADAQMESWGTGDRIPVFGEMKVLTLEILFETIFDYSIDPRGADSDIRAAVDALDLWFKPTSWVLPTWIPTPARRRFANASAQIDAIADDLLHTQSANSDGLLATLQDLAQMSDTEFTADEIRSQLRTFVFAGHETTASTLSFALYLLGTHPDVEARFHTELEHVLDGRPPSFTDIDQLEVTDHIIRETLRMYPPAFRLPRVAAEPVEIGGYAITPGSEVLVFTVTPHRDERFWDAPLEFRPQRWNAIDPDTTGCTYLPFGAGPRNCVGERFARTELVLLLASLGQQYAFQPESELAISARVAATPKNSLPMRVEAR